MDICNTTIAYKLLHDDDIVLHLLIKNFTALLSGRQRVEFGFILGMIIYKTSKYKTSENIAESSKQPSTTSTYVS